MASKLIKSIAGLFIMIAGAGAQAGFITYDTWTTNDGDSGNYILTVNDDTAGLFSVDLTVDPWNAEALGLFVDFGDFDVGAVGLTNENPSGEVSLYATDTSSNSCGSGCNLNGLSPPVANPDGQWELVFRLGAQGFDGIQTFSFQINDFGLTLADWGLVGIRAQQLCSGDTTLPDGSCDGSDKSYGAEQSPPRPVAEPSILLLLSAGFLGLVAIRRRFG